MALALSLVYASCAGKARHVAVVADTALYETLSDVHASEQVALCGQPSCAGEPDRPIAGWSKAKSLAFNQKLLPAVEAGRQYNRLLSQWQVGQPMPPQLAGLIRSLGDSLKDIAEYFPEGTSKTKIIGQIAAAQQIALSTLSAVLDVASTLKGAR